MMRIDSNAALTLAAFIRSALSAIDRIENDVARFNLNNLSPAEVDSLGYSLHYQTFAAGCAARRTPLTAGRSAWLPSRISKCLRIQAGSSQNTFTLESLVNRKRFRKAITGCLRKRTRRVRQGSRVIC